jgi:hypothetical protein
MRTHVSLTPTVPAQTVTHDKGTRSIKLWDFELSRRSLV